MGFALLARGERIIERNDALGPHALGLFARELCFDHPFMHRPQFLVLADRFPDGNAARLIRLEAEPLTRIGKDKHVARINLEGVLTADSKEWDLFLAHLNADGRYGVDSKGLKPNTILRGERFRFPQQFSGSISVEKREPAEYQLKLWKEPPPRKRDMQQPNGDAGFGAIGGELP